MPFLWEADVRERFAYPAALGVPGSGVGAVVSVTGVCCTPQAVVKSMVSARQTAGIFFIHIASLYIKTRETWDRFHKNVGKCAKFHAFPHVGGSNAPARGQSSLLFSAERRFSRFSSQRMGSHATSSSGGRSHHLRRSSSPVSSSSKRFLINRAGLPPATV